MTKHKRLPAKDSHQPFSKDVFSIYFVFAIPWLMVSFGNPDILSSHIIKSLILNAQSLGIL